jgi:hypothetical protein
MHFAFRRTIPFSCAPAVIPTIHDDDRRYLVRYSQPYGVAEVPVTPVANYPRYVNGNPVTGTAGSIPPNTAFDEDQIEILNVIINAGLTPTHSDLTQLWQALLALFAQRYITTPIIKTVHGAGADFPDLHEAMKWLAQYIITPTGYVTFMIAQGKWTYTTAVEINHPNSNRIAIQGGALLGATPQPENFSITGYHSASDGTNHIIYLRSVHSSELSFTGGVNGFVVLRPGCVLRYLLITGSQTYATGGIFPEGNGIWLQADIYVDGISIWGFGEVGIAINQYTCRMLTSLSFVCSFNGWQGMTIEGGQFIGTFLGSADVILVSNDISGLTNYGGLVWGGYDKFTIRGHGPPNGNAAVHCEQGGLIAVGFDSVFSDNQNGVICAGAATWIGEDSSYTNNAVAGFTATGTVTAWLDNSLIQNNGQYGVIASSNAFVEVLGSLISDPVTPPLNEVGNIESYIYA